MKVEIAEELQGSASRSDIEPIMGLAHGPSGTGKTVNIRWVQRMFIEALGWTHGVQYVCLSYLNAMAADIDGFIVHHWAGIPVGEEEEGTAGTKDTAKMSTRCQCLRFILIDEISMVSCELLTTLESIVTRVVRIRSGYKRRADGST